MRIISLKIYNSVSELVPISEGSQDWKEGKIARIKAAFTLLYYQTSRPESPTGKDIYESSSQEDMSQKFQVRWSYSTRGRRSLLRQKAWARCWDRSLWTSPLLLYTGSPYRPLGNYFYIRFINGHWPMLNWLWPLDIDIDKDKDMMCGFEE